MTVKEEIKMFEKIRYNVENGLGFVESMKLEKVGKRYYEPTLRKYLKWEAEVFDADEIEIDVEELDEEDANLISSIKKDVDRMVKALTADIEMYKKLKVALSA